VPTIDIKAESSESASNTTSNVPSQDYLKTAEGYIKLEKASLAGTDKYDVFLAPRGVMSGAELWKDPTMPEEDWSPGGNMGAPIADATLPIVFSIFVIYLIYRNTTTSRRKNNF